MEVKPVVCHLFLAVWIVFCLVDFLPAKTEPESGLLCPPPPRTDLKAQWIWLPDDAGIEWRNSYAYFRKKFTASGKATLHIAADTWYNLYLDGKLIERGTAAADVNYKIFDTHALILDPGPHVLAVLVHHLGQVCATAMKSRPGLFVELQLQDGSLLRSDSTWKTLPAKAYRQYLPCMMSHFGFYEVCDEAQVPQGWSEPEFDDRTWFSAQVIGPAGCAPWLRMIPRDIPLLSTVRIPVQSILCRGRYQPGPIPESVENLSVAVEMAYRLRQKQTAAFLEWPLTLAQGEQSEFVVLDFGREVTGHVRLRFKPAPVGQKIDIGYDETLDANGLPNPRRTYVHFADRFLLANGQEEASVYGARGFRYLLVDIASGKGGLILTGAEIDERTYPITRQGRFMCSDSVLNRLYTAGLTTTRLCMLDTYVDCPSRERVMWMDLYPEAHCGSYGFGEVQLWRRCLYLFAQNTCRDGLVAGCIRSLAPCDYDPLLISYMMYWVISLADYIQHSGDLQTAEALFPTAMHQFEIISHFLTPEGLINEKFPSWGTFLDWSAMDFGGVSAGNNAIYLLMHRKTAALARLLNKTEIAQSLESQGDRLTKCFHQTFWNQQEGLYIDAVTDGRPSPVRSQWVNAMAVLAGVVKDDRARSLLRKIIDPQRLLPRTRGDFRLSPNFKVQTGGIVQIGTPGSGFLLTQALFAAGLDQEAIRYYKEHWMPIIRNSTFMEHFVEDANTSYCHGWGAGPVVSFAQYILGVSPQTPGWKQITIRPHAGDLTWAAGTIPTPSGEIKVSWKKEKGKIKLSYETPDAIQVVLP